ncbi:MAG: S-adenosylmethionine decarboxylase [Chloroflexi bacterium]|nr:S-adenosylmethionine decarboxylase [Chloroflexota bacterium]
MGWRPEQKIEQVAKRDQQPQFWGLSSCIDLYDCDLGLMQDAEAIKEFVRLLCDRIKVNRFGEAQVVRFGAEPRIAGFSMMQLIETSLISAHFADASRAIYLDVFSCSPYDPDQVASFAVQFFKAGRHSLQVIQRR